MKSRCAAVGAAIVVTFGLGGMNFASATVATGARNVFVPIVPCRLFDTRPAPSTVGGRSVPIVKDEQLQVVVRGQHGDCSISSGATAVVLNVTALDAVGDGFLTVWPAENPLPNTSNLNFSNGQSPVANAVTVKLDSAGTIKFSTSSTSLNVIADVVGYFEDHNHADAYKPSGTVLGTTVVNTTTTLPATTTTVPLPVFDVPDAGNALTNGNNLRAFLVGKTNRTVTIAPVGYNIGSTPLVVPPGIVLTGVTQYDSYIVGDSLTNPPPGPPQSLPIVKLLKNATLTNIGVSGRSGGAGVEAVTVSGFTAVITNVSISVSQALNENGAIYNSGSGILRMTNVRTRSRYGVNNDTGSIVIFDSDLDGVVQNGAGGDISVTNSIVGFNTPWPQSGVTAYKTGLIKLTNVTVYSALVGIWATDGPPPGTGPSRIEAQDGSILSQFPVQASSAGITTCANVAKAGGGVFSLNCT